MKIELSYYRDSILISETLLYDDLFLIKLLRGHDNDDNNGGITASVQLLIADCSKLTLSK